MAVVSSLDFSADIRMAKFERALRQSRRRLRRWSRQVSRDLRRITAAVGVSTAGSAATVLREFTRLEQQMTQIATRTGESMQRVVQQYGDGLRHIVRQTGQTTQDVADAIQKSISGGVGGERAIELVGQAARFSAAGLGEMASAVSAATTIVVAFAEDNISVAEALGAVSRAAQLGEGDAQDYSQAIKQVSAFAATAGLSVTEMAGALATVAQVDPSVDQAATNFRSFLQALIKPTPQARQALESIGLEIDLLREKFRTQGFVQTFAELRNQIVGAEIDFDRLGRLFENKQAAQFFLQVRPENLAATTQALEETFAGTVDRAFSEIEGTLQFRLNRLTQRFRLGLADIGERLSTLITPARFNVFLRLTDKAVQIIGSLVDAFVALIGVLVRYREIIGTVLAAWLALKAAMLASNVGSAIVALVSHISLLAKALVGLNFAALGATTTFSLIGFAVGALVAAVGYLAVALPDELGKVLGLFRDWVAAIGRLLQAVWQLLEDLRMGLRDTFVRSLQAALVQAQYLILQFLAKLNEAAIRIIGTLQKVGRAFAALTPGGVTEDIQRLLTLGDEIAEGREAAIARIRDDSAGLVQELADLYGGQETRTGGVFGRFLEEAGESVGEFGARIRETGAEVHDLDSQLRQSVVDLFGAAADDVRGKFEALKSLFTLPATDPDAGAAGLSGAAAAAPEAPKSEPEATRGLFRPIAEDAVESMSVSLKDAFARADFSGLGKALLTNIHQVLTDALFNQLGQLLRNAFPGLLGGLQLFHEGGIVPGRRGQDVPIIAEGGEAVLTVDQQRQLLQGVGGSTTVNFQVTGNVDDATLRALYANARQLTDLVQTGLQERRAIA